MWLLVFADEKHDEGVAHTGPASTSTKNTGKKTKKQNFTVPKLSARVEVRAAEEVRAEGGMEPLGHKWSEDECKLLWTYVEDLQAELFHGKDNLTRPQVVARITTMLSKLCEQDSN